MNSPTRKSTGASKDRRVAGFALALALILGIGVSIKLIPGPRPGTEGGGPPPKASTASGRAAAVPVPAVQDSATRGEVSDKARDAVAQRLARAFDRAVRLLHEGKNKEALIAWRKVLKLAPNLPEAHVDMGFTLLSLGRPEEARVFFNSAIMLRAGQANAYYGLALALNRLHDPRGAIRAMRDYLGHTDPDDRYAEKARLLIQIWKQCSISEPVIVPVEKKGPMDSR